MSQQNAKPANKEAVQEKRLKNSSQPKTNENRAINGKNQRSPLPRDLPKKSKPVTSKAGVKMIASPRDKQQAFYCQKQIGNL